MLANGDSVCLMVAAAAWVSCCIFFFLRSLKDILGARGLCVDSIDMDCVRVLPLSPYGTTGICRCDTCVDSDTADLVMESFQGDVNTAVLEDVIADKDVQGAWSISVKLPHGRGGQPGLAPQGKEGSVWVCGSAS